MERTYPIEITKVNGREFVNMSVEVFYTFFMDSMKYSRVQKDELDKMTRDLTAAKRVKKKRISIKKQKQALIAMYNLLYREFIA